MFLFHNYHQVLVEVSGSNEVDFHLLHLLHLLHLVYFDRADIAPYQSTPPLLLKGPSDTLAPSWSGSQRDGSDRCLCLFLVINVWRHAERGNLIHGTVKAIWCCGPDKGTYSKDVPERICSFAQSRLSRNVIFFLLRRNTFSIIPSQWHEPGVNISALNKGTCYIRLHPAIIFQYCIICKSFYWLLLKNLL